MSAPLVRPLAWVVFVILSFTGALDLLASILAAPDQHAAGGAVVLLAASAVVLWLALGARMRLPSAEWRFVIAIGVGLVLLGVAVLWAPAGWTPL